MALNETIRKFIEEIKLMPEFIELLQSKAAIQKSKAVKSEVEEFVKKQRQLYASKLPANELQSRLEGLNEKFKSLSQISEVGIYLKALNRFNERLTKVYKSIDDSIGEDLKF